MFMNLKSLENLPGTYYLRDVHEVESGFRIHPDQVFQFFLSHGALDRYGAGKWAVAGSEISFHSRPWPGQDFALNGSTETKDNFVAIRITDKNQNILRFVAGSIKSGERGSWYQADEKGFIYFPKQDVTSIALISEFSAERVSVFNIESTSHNYFEFRFEPWIMEYFFVDFRLTITDSGLKGKHPMLQGDQYVYKKKKNMFW